MREFNPPRWAKVAHYLLGNSVLLIAMFFVGSIHGYGEGYRQGAREMKAAVFGVMERLIAESDKGALHG